MMEVAALLSVMICSSAEDSQLLLFNWSHGEEVKLKSDVLLENVRGVMKQVEVRSFIYFSAVFIRARPIYQLADVIS